MMAATGTYFWYFADQVMGESDAHAPSLFSPPYKVSWLRTMWEGIVNRGPMEPGFPSLFLFSLARFPMQEKAQRFR